MPTKERNAELYRQLLDAALDQPKPSLALRSAINKLLKSLNSSLSLKPTEEQIYDELELLPFEYDGIVDGPCCVIKPLWKKEDSPAQVETNGKVIDLMIVLKEHLDA